MKKNILITGCSSGIGLAAVKILHNEGFNVFATVRDQDDFHQLKDLSTPLLCDLADLSACERMCEEFISKTDGNIYGLFNNAAYGQPAAVMDLPTEALIKQFNVNLFAQHLITRKLVPYMIEQGQGRVVFNSSVLGIVHMPMRAAYSSSKFALEALAASFRLELAQHNIQVSIVRPGPVKTQFKQNSYKALQSNIDYKNTLYPDWYKKLVTRLIGIRPSKAVTAESVAFKVLHAFTSASPNNYYRSSINTYMTEVAIRVLPSFLIDRLVIKSF